MRGTLVLPYRRRELGEFTGLSHTERGKKKVLTCRSEIFQQQIALCLTDAQAFLRHQSLVSVL